MKRPSILFFLVLLSSAVYAQQLVLEKVTVVSRHGVRAPLDSYISTLEEMTGDNFQWPRWAVPGSNLTLRGGALEMLFGEYFKLWLDDEHLYEKCAKVQDVYFGASSKQRTIATARSFAAGLFPLMAVPIDYKLTADSAIGFLDRDYLPLLNSVSAPDGNFDTNKFKEEAYSELGQMQAPSYQFLEEVLRMSQSRYAKKKGIAHFDDKIGVRLDFYNSATGCPLEPTMCGGLKDAIMASDAFILQYYEMANATDSVFGRKLSFEDREKLASVNDSYRYFLFSKAPIISVNVSHCMLQRIQTELSAGGHRFAFFCTHDSMIEALLAALRTEPYILRNSIEAKTPIGCKLVFEQWTETCCLNPKKYIRIRMLYQSADQIREMRIMDLANPPMSCEITFEGLKKASNGMYYYDDFMKHIQKSIDAYKATAQGKRPW